MSVEIQWTDTDPATGERRFVSVERFAGKWHFKVRFRRRTDWDRSPQVTRDMLESLLDAVERRYPRREGVTDKDLAHVKKLLAEHRDPPSVEG